MSKDIRSYFTSLSKKPASVKTDTPKKRSISDLNTSDDIVPDTPENNTKKKNDKSHSKRRRIVVVSSDSETENDRSTVASSKASQKISNKPNQKRKKEIETPTTAKPNVKLIKETETSKTTNSILKTTKELTKKKVNPLDAFGGEPIAQERVKKIQQSELNIHEDDDFDKTLIELDEDELFKKADVNTTKKEDKQHVNKSSVSSDDSKHTPTKPKGVTPAKKPHDKKDSKEKTPLRKRKSNEDESDPNVDPDLDRFEKKRHSAMLYQKYLSRSGPAHLGAKWIPKGKPNCLNGLCFIITGVLDSMQREDAQTLITEHGGRCTQSVSGKVNYMVLGDDAGPAKVEKARKLGTKMISEDDLIDLICLKSGIQNQNIKNEPSSENTSTPQEKQEPTRNKPPPKQEKVKIEQISDDEEEIPSTTVKEEVVKVKKSVPVVPKIERVKKEVSDEGGLAWVDKYKPRDVSQIIGQQGERSNMNKLMRWLQDWHKNRAKESSGKGIPKPSPWAKDDSGAYFRAALLSGPPGVGKTTTASLVCLHLGLDTVEFNASDTRSKRLLQREVAHVVSSASLAAWAPTSRRVLLMDEVDGMSGNEDRGGVQELVQLIKTSAVPVVCMCNDRQHPKIRTLANYCFDLRFSKPRVEQIRGAMMSVCFKEKLGLKGDALTQIIQSTGQDIRQTLNQLSLQAAGAPEQQAQQVQKDVKLGPWEVVRKVFSEEEHKHMSFSDHTKLFFYDYSIGPLFVQENYLKVAPHAPASQHLELVAAAADAISMGDVVDARIRSAQSWGLLELQAVYASARPGQLLRGHVAGQIDFPGWLGKNSKANKFQRLLTEVHGHTRMSTSCDRVSVALDLVRPLRDAVTQPLLQRGLDGISAALACMRSYSLLREDLASLTELAHWPRTPDPFDAVNSKVKAAFTRAYNKDSPALPYAAPAAGPVKKRAAANSEDLYAEEQEEEGAGDSEPEDDKDDINTDAMIKMKTSGSAKASAASKASSSKGKASSSKGKAPASKGRGGKRGK